MAHRIQPCIIIALTTYRSGEGTNTAGSFGHLGREAEDTTGPRLAPGDISSCKLILPTKLAVLAKWAVLGRVLQLKDSPYVYLLSSVIGTPFVALSLLKKKSSYPPCSEILL